MWKTYLSGGIILWSIAGMVVGSLAVSRAEAAEAEMENQYFPSHLLHAEWVRFEARGYSGPVTGVIYRGRPRPTCGVPLGGIDTGCVDIEPSGMLGYCTVFNHLVNPRLLLNLPFLGIHVGGKTWVLVSDKLAKEYTPVPNSSMASWPRTDYTPKFSQIPLEGVATASAIDYWGHYPVLDMQYRTDAPVAVAMRCWSPFLPGDAQTSMLPGILFEFILTNTSAEEQEGSLAFSFPGFEMPPVTEDSPDANVSAKYTKVGGELNGLQVVSPHEDDSWEMGYVLAVLDETSVRSGGPLRADGQAWSGIDKKLPGIGPRESGATVAYDFRIAPARSKTVRMVLTWYAPHWKSGGAPSHTETNTFTHMYAKYFPSALAAAQQLARNHDSFLRRIIRWQEVVYQDQDTPGWLADQLINILHLIPECSVWGQARAPIGAWCKQEDGLFALNECPRGCPQMECIPCSFYGNIPLVYFYPECALSTLRAYKAYQFPDGRPPWIFGGVTAREGKNKNPYDLATPDTGYQTILNGACYVVMFDRYWQRTGDRAVLQEFWVSLKRCNDFSMNLRPEYGPSQVISMPTPGIDPYRDTEWFEAEEPGWKGYVTHAGGIRMAQVMVMHKLAGEMNDADYVKKCVAWLEAGAEALEEYLWAGEYYLNFNEPETKTSSKLVFGYQLDGEWIADWHGVPGVFPRDRVAKTLATIRRINCRLSQSGAVNYANPDGTVAKVGGYGSYSYFPPELMMLAMNYMYEGEKDFGVELLYKCMHNLTCKWSYTWDGVNTTRGDMDTGQRNYGADYYQDMMLWAVPAALKGESLAAPCKKGGLVDRIIQAAK